MNYIFLSDIHSNIKALQKIKGLPEYQDSHIVFGGDYVDGFHQDDHAGIDVIRFIMDLVDQGKASAILGNHDDAFLKFVENPYDNPTWLQIGGMNSIKSWGIDNYQPLPSIQADLRRSFHQEIDFLKTLPLIWQKDNMIMVHAGVNLSRPLDQQAANDLLWIRDDYFNDQGERHPFYNNKIIITGHTPNQLIDPYNEGKIIITTKGCLTKYLIDGGSKGKPSGGITHINVLVLDENGEFVNEYNVDDQFSHSLHL